MIKETQKSIFLVVTPYIICIIVSIFLISKIIPNLNKVFGNFAETKLIVTSTEMEATLSDEGNEYNDVLYGYFETDDKIYNVKHYYNEDKGIPDIIYYNPKNPSENYIYKSSFLIPAIIQCFGVIILLGMCISDFNSNKKEYKEIFFSKK